MGRPTTENETYRPTAGLETHAGSGDSVQVAAAEPLTPSIFPAFGAFSAVLNSFLTSEDAKNAEI